MNLSKFGFKWSKIALVITNNNQIVTVSNELIAFHVKSFHVEWKNEIKWLELLPLLNSWPKVQKRDTNAACGKNAETAGRSGVYHLYRHHWVSVKYPILSAPFCA